LALRSEDKQTASQAFDQQLIMLLLRASVGSTEATAPQSTSVSSARSKLGSIDFGIVGSGAMRPDSGAGRRLGFRGGAGIPGPEGSCPTKLCDVK
jgi:hypothetical protein